MLNTFILLNKWNLTKDTSVHDKNHKNISAEHFLFLKVQRSDPEANELGPEIFNKVR